MPEPSPDQARPATPPPRDLWLRLIIVEKGIKAGFVLLVGVCFATLLVTGTSVHLHGIAARLREHVSAAWSVYAADAAVSATERRHLTVITSALFLDGVTTSLEWYALLKGHAWGEWLVVVAMSLFIPFEVAALLHGFHAGRFVVLAGNVAIVAYLAAHAWKRHVARGATTG